jgi:hypothetical protein
MSGIPGLWVREILGLLLLPFTLLAFLVRRGAIRRDLRRILERSARRSAAS